MGTVFREIVFTFALVGLLPLQTAFAGPPTSAAEEASAVVITIQNPESGALVDKSLLSIQWSWEPDVLADFNLYYIARGGSNVIATNVDTPGFYVWEIPDHVPSGPMTLVVESVGPEGPVSASVDFTLHR